MIKEDYVSFETAKLLKEKGFTSDNCHTAYDGNGEFFWYGDYSKDRKGIMDAPTIQMAMKWLRDIHNLFIGLDYVNIAGLGCVYQASIVKLTDYYNYCVCKHSYEEACEASIKYCLENLI